METKYFFPYEIIINFLVTFSSFRFIWIFILCIHGHYIIVNSFNAGIYNRGQNSVYRVCNFHPLEAVGRGNDT